MKKTLFTILLAAVMSSISLYGQSGKAPNFNELTTEKEFTKKADENFPTTNWIDNADTSWYNSTSTSFTLGNAEQLAGLAKLVFDGNDFLGKTIIISNDIDVGKHLWTSIGYGYQKPFSGTVLGNNHTIKNVLINRPTGDFIGFFGQAFKATFKDLKIDNIKVRAKDTAGCFVGNLSTNSLVDNCHVTNAEIITTSYNIGGFAGSVLTDSFVNNSSFEGYVEGKNQVGGFTGNLWDKSTITNSFAKGKVVGGYIIGGFVGFTTMAFGPNRMNTIKDSYSISEVEAELERAGGFAGYAQTALTVENTYTVSTVKAPMAVGTYAGMIGSAKITNSYFDETISILDGVGTFEFEGVTADVTGNTTTAMKNETFADKLNASNSEKPWKFVSGLNDNYPVLKFQNLNTQEYLTKNINVRIYPTATDKMLNIESNKEVLDYKINDLNGRSYSKIKSTNNQKQIDVSSLPKGVYIITIQTTGGIKNLKFIKK